MTTLRDTIQSHLRATVKEAAVEATAAMTKLRKSFSDTERLWDQRTFCEALDKMIDEWLRQEGVAYLSFDWGKPRCLVGPLNSDAGFNAEVTVSDSDPPEGHEIEELEQRIAGVDRFVAELMDYRNRWAAELNKLKNPAV